METSEKRTFGTFKIIGDWESHSKQLKEQFPELTDEDLKFKVNQEHELLNRIEARIGKKRDELIIMIRKMQEQKTK